MRQNPRYNLVQCYTVYRLSLLFIFCISNIVPHDMLTKLHSLMSCTSKRIVSMSHSNEHEQSVGIPCSGRGDCLNGTCICEIRYSGDECDNYNISYHASVSSVFYFVAALSLIQLFICCKAEYQKKGILVQAIRLNIQKLLYFVVFIAALLRGAYFTTPGALQPDWASFLISAYYPLLLTCSSLVVCLWAEIFHLRNVRATQFLSKSFLGFLAFNILPYSLFGAEILSTHVSKKRNVYASIFSGCYAFLLLIVLIFFLIYGVEVFFKIRGEWINQQMIPNHSTESSEQSSSETTKNTRINIVQVSHARFGLLSQAVMMTIIVVFLASETLGDFWKQKVPVYYYNIYDIIFRLFEVGFALWFPCCLWNSTAPEQLWILNPRKLLSRQADSFPQLSKEGASAEEGQTFLKLKDCWICYDSEKAEPLIQPCKCTGDVSSVHHECLRRWLVESCSKSENPMKCRVCNTPYEVTRTKRLYWTKGFTINHWAKTIILISTICITTGFAWVIIQTYVDPIIRVVTAGIAILIGYICIKLLGENTVLAVNRAKLNSINIINGDSSSSEKLYY